MLGDAMGRFTSKWLVSLNDDIPDMLAPLR